jgi:tetratricopeptide (TPR) repeat protein
LFCRAKAFRNAELSESAIKDYESAIALRADIEPFFTNLGNIYRDVHRFDEALVCHERACSLSPESVTPKNNLALTFKDLGRFSEALESYDRALSLEPDSAEVNWNKSLLLLLQGNYAEGWPLYEWRLKRDELSADYPQFQQPLWRGEMELSGKRLLIHVEQGLGDMVQFCRFVPELVSRGAEVILQVQKPLMPLISTLVSDISLIAKGDPLPEFDLYCPLMSLPYALGLTTETIPSFDSYLSADPLKVEDWHNKLGPSNLLRVGVVWSGRPEHKNDHNRSISLDALSPILDLPVEWHSLQKEYRASDVDLLSTLDQLHQHQEALSDFSDTAALIENMDLVVTVDTSVAHVACALGKPTWVLLPYLSDFRWLLDRSDSPWYPSATLYRQKEPGDWSPVFAKLTEDLAEKIDAY